MCATVHKGVYKNGEILVYKNVVVTICIAQHITKNIIHDSDTVGYITILMSQC